MPGPRDRRGARRSEVEAGLVAALEHLIVDEPHFTEIPLARLLEHTGISRTTFYKYFDAKTDVLLAWFEQNVDALLDTRQARTVAPTRDELRGDLRAIADVYRRRLPLLNAVYETAAHDADVRARLAATLAEFGGRVRRDFARGQKAGWVNPAIDPGPMAAWVVALSEGSLRYVIGPGPRREVEASVAAWADTVFFTVYEFPAS